VDYIDKNRVAGGLYISLNTEELQLGIGSICDRLVNVEYISQDESKSFSSDKQL
jgi:hypothetical protein